MTFVRNYRAAKRIKSTDYRIGVNLFPYSFDFVEMSVDLWDSIFAPRRFNKNEIKIADKFLYVVEVNYAYELLKANEYLYVDRNNELNPYYNVAMELLSDLRSKGIELALVVEIN